jgi:hypothetical protein
MGRWKRYELEQVANFLRQIEVAVESLPQRVDRDAHGQGQGSGCHAEGHSCPGRRQGS